LLAILQPDCRNAGPQQAGAYNTPCTLGLRVTLTRFFGSEKSWKAGFAVLPLALFAGISFTIAYALTGVFLGLEFPSLAAGLIGLAIVTSATRMGFLLLKTTWDFAPTEKWPAEWLGTVEMKLDQLTAKPISALRAWLPYVLVGVLLVISRD
jgi:lactate permease